MKADMGTPNRTTSETLAEYADLVQGVAARVAAFHAGLQGVLNIQTAEDPNYYHAYPFLFKDEFPSVQNEAASTLAVAGVFYLNHLCLLDDVVDSSAPPQPYKLFLSALLHEEALVQLSSLLPASSPFWPALSSYHREFVAAMLQERTLHHNRVTRYTDEETFQIAKGKAALSKMTTTALALLANRPETIAAFSISQDYFNAARQMYDDVKDWKDDYLNRRYSSLLTAALLGPGEEAGATRFDDLEAVSARLHYGGHIELALTQAVKWCDEAAHAVDDYNTSGWKRLIQSLRAQVVRLHKDLEAIRQDTKEKATAQTYNELNLV